MATKDAFKLFLKELRNRFSNGLAIPDKDTTLPAVMWSEVDKWWETEFGVENKFVAKGMILATLKAIEGVKYGGPEQKILEQSVTETQRLFKDPDTRTDLFIQYAPVYDEIIKTAIKFNLQGPEILLFTIMLMRVQNEVREDMRRSMEGDCLNDDDDFENSGNEEDF